MILQVPVYVSEILSCFILGAPNGYEYLPTGYVPGAEFFCDEGRINIGKHMLQGYVIPGYVTVPIGFILKNCFGEGKPWVKLPKIMCFYFRSITSAERLTNQTPLGNPSGFLKSS